MAAIIIVVAIVFILILLRYQRGENYRAKHPEQFSKEPNPEGAERHRITDEKIDELMRIAEWNEPSEEEYRKMDAETAERIRNTYKDIHKSS
jgi:hypothetical protein